MRKDNTKLFLEGCKWISSALISWMLIHPRLAWFQLEKAKEIFASIKRNNHNIKD